MLTQCHGHHVGVKILIFSIFQFYVSYYHVRNFVTKDLGVLINF